MLINPPASRPVLRDYYCSTCSKTYYYWQPVDLLVAASIIRQKSVVKVVDAVAAGLSENRVIQMVREFEPGGIYALVSTLNRKGDLLFLEKLQKKGRRIVIGGEVALERNFDFAQYPFIDALITDFTSPELGEFMDGGEPSGRIHTAGHAPDKPLINGEYSVGVMPHEMFTRGRYRLPLWRGSFYSLLTDFGCPYSCRFCNSGRKSLGYKTRDLDEISRELKLLKAMGAKKLYIRDMTFGADREHAYRVLRLLAPYHFRLRAFVRAADITSDFAARMKAAGFDMVQIGVETPDERKRKVLRKKLGNIQLYEAFDILDRFEIRTGAHFIVGFADDSLCAPLRCYSMARRLRAAYCSINMYQQRLGSEYICSVVGLKRCMMSLLARLCMYGYNLPEYIRYAFRN